MSARAVSAMSAVMDDDDAAVEGGADSLGGDDVRRHVRVRVFRAVEAAVERVYDDRDGAQPAPDDPKLIANSIDERRVIGNQAERRFHEIETWRAVALGDLVAAKSFDAPLEAAHAL